MKYFPSSLIQELKDWIVNLVSPKYDDNTTIEIVDANTNQTLTKTIKTLFESVFASLKINRDNVENLELRFQEFKSGVIEFAQGFYNKEEKIPATAIQDDITHRFVTDTDKANWDGKEDKVKIVNTLAETTEKGIYIVEDDTNVYDDLIANGARIETFIAIVDRVEQTTDNGLWIIKESDIDG